MQLSMLEIKKVSNVINEMAKLDQEMIINDSGNNSLFVSNTTKLKKIISEHGYPLISVFGEQVSFNTWLII